MATLLLSLLSPDATCRDFEVTRVVLPGQLGRFEVLPQHAPTIAALVEGDVVYVVDGVEDRIHIKSGVVEICKDKVSVCFTK